MRPAPLYLCHVISGDQGEAVARLGDAFRHRLVDVAGHVRAVEPAAHAPLAQLAAQPHRALVVVAPEAVRAPVVREEAIPLVICSRRGC
eukprot:scaffold53887_cov57-Phaeocystis_antarctica.AAC.1